MTTMSYSPPIENICPYCGCKYVGTSCPRQACNTPERDYRIARIGDVAEYNGKLSVVYKLRIQTRRMTHSGVVGKREPDWTDWTDLSANNVRIEHLEAEETDERWP